jgi:DNA-binding transcriptional MerR regulator
MPTEIEGIIFYTVPETAKALKVTPKTIRAWKNRGELRAKE